MGGVDDDVDRSVVKLEESGIGSSTLRAHF